MRLLSRQGFLSGQVLADTLSVSRTTIATWIHDLENYGIEINTVKGRGYRLVSEVDFLNKSILLKQLSSENTIKMKVVDVLSESSSTNAICMQYGFQDGDWKLVATEFQTLGRGRRGRAWESEPFKNLLFSLGHCGTLSSDVLYCSSILAGQSVVKSLSSYFKDENTEQFKVKWPNDIYFNDCKVAGILCELKGSPLDESTLVIGIGMNVLKSPKIEGYPTTCLRDCFPGKNINRSELLGSIVNGLISTFEHAKSFGTSEALSNWSDFDYLMDRKIKVMRGKDSFNGIARGIDKKGQLVVMDTEGNMHSLNGGEVSVRW